MAIENITDCLYIILSNAFFIICKVRIPVKTYIVSYHNTLNTITKLYKYISIYLLIDIKFPTLENLFRYTIVTSTSII